MRIRNRRNPKVRDLTPEQEAEYERYEAMMARARILRDGVGKLLTDTSSYPCEVEVSEAARVLNEAVTIQRKASVGRAAIRKAADEAEASAKPKRKAKTA